MPRKKQQPLAITSAPRDEPQGIATKPREESRLVQMKQARHLLGGVCADTLYQLIADGKLDSFKIGSRRVVTRASIDRYIQQEVAVDRKMRFDI